MFLSIMCPRYDLLLELHMLISTAYKPKSWHRFSSVCGLRNLFNSTIVATVQKCVGYVTITDQHFVDVYTR